MSSGNCCVSQHAVAVICNSTVTLTCELKWVFVLHGWPRVICSAHATLNGRLQVVSNAALAASWSQRRALGYKGHRRERTAGFLSFLPLFTFYISSSDMSSSYFFSPSSSGVAFTMRRGSFFCPVAWWITWHATSWRGLVSSRLPEEPCQIDVPVT